MEPLSEESLRESCLLNLYSSEGCCKRCRGLDILPLLVTGETRSRTGTSGGMRFNLGPYKDLFCASSPESCKLCTLLQAVLPIPGIDPRADLYLVTARILSRLEPEVKVHYYERDESFSIPEENSLSYPDSVKESLNLGYSNILYLSQKRAEGEVGRLGYADEAPNAIGIALTNSLKGSKSAFPMMPTRKVHPSVADIPTILEWFKICDKDHGVRCRSRSTTNLTHIRLIDVNARIVVPYPQDGACEYVCLSYVWGETMRKRWRDGSKLLGLPRTLEDALGFVKALGKQYLWIDSVCIDQSNEEDKQRQMCIMDQIYQGSWATLVALSGDSVDSGLSRAKVDNLDQTGYSSQVSGTFGKIQLMTTLPTLRQQVESSVWTTRAWTYQEAILAPRCLYFSKDQVYFECNVMQCCESLDESSSSYHNASQTSKEYMSTSCHCHGKTQHAVGKGVLRDPMAEVLETYEWLFTKHRLEYYNELVTTYSARKMRYTTDVIKACTAILQQLEVAPGGFGSGFFWGLPTEELQSAILWTLKGEGTRRAAFPSWSWAGWEGALEKAALYLDQRDTVIYTAPFRAWKADKDGFRMISSMDRGGCSRPYDRGEGVDPVYDALFTPKPNLVFDSVRFSTERISRMLLVEALVVDLELDQTWDVAAQSREQEAVRERYGVGIPNSLLGVRIDGKDFYFYCWNSQTVSILKRTKNVTLLLAERRGWKDDFLILKRTDPGCAVRVGTVRTLFRAEPLTLSSAKLEVIALE